MDIEKTFSRVSRGLWFVPLACVVAGVGLSLGTIAIDKAFDYKLVPQTISGGPDAAMEILATVAASMVSLAALVLTITMVVVQLAMGQFSPRIVQRILEDKPSQLAIGIFVGTFAHAMLALREVQTEGEGVVPGVAVVVAFVYCSPVRKMKSRGKAIAFTPREAIVAASGKAMDAAGLQGDHEKCGFPQNCSAIPLRSNALEMFL